MAELHTIGAGLNPDDLWRNVFWLRGRIEVLEAKVRALEAATQAIPAPVEPVRLSMA